MKNIERGPLALAISVALLGNAVAFSAPGDVNSTNTGQNVQGGTYFNTPGSRTTFINNNGSLHVGGGVVVRGLESSATRTPTGNGGTMYFRAPDNVIRIDGTIDVSALRNGSTYLGNGGKAFFDSAFLFQNGNVFANGFNGGVIQYNVGGMTAGPNARITAQGFGGNGGSITINSPGTVDIRSGAILDSSGLVTGTFDTNVINIAGSVVNNEGVVRANGLAGTDFKQNNGDSAVIAANPALLNNPPPGTITGGQGTGFVDTQPADFQPNTAPEARGGTIRLVAAGQTFSTTDAVNRSPVLSTALKTDINNRANTFRNFEGTLLNPGTLQANGAAGRNGGTVLISTANSIRNSGTIQANGLNGGTLGISSLDINGNNGLFEANGATQNGTGGLIGLAFNRLNNTMGTIRANGRNGGLVAFVSPNAPSGLGFGIVQAAGIGGTAGTVLTPQPNLVPTSLWNAAAMFQLPVGARQARVLQSNNNELLLHQENGLLFTQNRTGGGPTPVNLTGRLAAATIRTVAQPTGIVANAVDSVKHKSNIMIGGTNPNPLVLDFVNANINPIFTRPMSLMVVNNGDVTNNMHWSPGVMQVGPGFHDNVSSLGGGHISILSRGTITNNGFLLTRGLWSGGHVNLAATGNVTNNRVILNTAFNKDLATGFTPTPGLLSSHAGGTVLKAGGNILNTHRINSNLSFFDIHAALDTPGQLFPLFLNGAQIGATNYLQARGTITNNANAHISSDALTYRRGTLGIENPANTIGGILTLQATGGVTNNGNISATGRAFQGFVDGRTADGPRIPAGTTFAELQPAASQDGNILIK